MRHLYHAYTDGSIEGGNPGGHAVSAWVLKKGGEEVGQGVVDLGSGPDKTNNKAEYAAVLDLVEFLVRNDYYENEVIVHSDSKLVVHQLLGNWNSSKPHIKEYINKILDLKQWFDKSGGYLDFKWIPRELNGEADRLSRSLYKKV